jgi:MFS family permease
MNLDGTPKYEPGIIPHKFPSIFHSFEVIPFRWLWLSILFSSMSMGTRMLAQGWLVLNMTDSAFWVGAIAGIQGLGLVSFGTIGGAIVDRFEKRKVITAVHLCTGIASGITAVLVITSTIELWHMPLLAFAQGLAMAIQIPGNNSLAYSLVGPERLLNAMAARLAAMNISRIIGSLVAGSLIAQFGIGSAYLFATLGSLLGIAFLWRIPRNSPSTNIKAPFWEGIKQGMIYAWGNSTIKRLLILSLFMEAFGFSHFVMMPVMARDVLEVGPVGLGYLSAASGFGSALSTIAVASLGDFHRKGVLLTVAALSAGISLVLFALSPWFIVSLLLVALVGGALMAYDVTMATMLQLLSIDKMRGRVLGIYGLTFGFTPLGGLVVGSVAAVFSASLAISVGWVIITLYVASLARHTFRLVSTNRQTPQIEDCEQADELTED